LIDGVAVDVSILPSASAINKDGHPYDELDIVKYYVKLMNDYSSKQPQISLRDYLKKQ
jgi:hypothetical protein